MTDPVYALIFAALAGALLTAIVVPAPAHPVRDEGGAHVSLLGAACLATIVMGILALLARPAESTVCGAVAWLLVMPCVWLARAPRRAGGWGDDEEDDDHDGGSPSPSSPSAPPVPDDRLPGLRPSAWPAAHAAWGAPARATPVTATVTATATTVQRMLAAREAQTLRAAAALAARPQAERAADVVTQPSPTSPAPEPEPAPATQQRRAPLTPRVRADHRSIVHLHAADAHVGRRRATMGPHGAKRDSRLVSGSPSAPRD